MVDLAGALRNLKDTTRAEASNVLEQLRSGVYSLEGVSEEVTQVLVELINSHKNGDDKDCIDVVAAIVAEIAKEESARLVLTQDSVIEPLTATFGVSSNSACLIECSRALANLCYDNDNARLKIMANGGHCHLVDHIKRCSAREEDVEIVGCQGSETNTGLQPRLKMVLMGFLQNLINANEVLQEAVASLAPISSLVRYLKDEAENLQLVRFTILCLHSLSDQGEAKQVLQSPESFSILLSLFKSCAPYPASSASTGTQTVDRELVDLLSVCMADKESLMLMVASSKDVGAKILHMVSQYAQSSDEDDERFVGALADLVVRVLSGDDAMNLWFDEGQGEVYQALRSDWVNSPLKVVQLSAALGLGNCARKESHCALMLKDGTVQQSLDKLRELSPHMDLMSANTHIHALLGHIRNISLSHAGSAYLREEKELEFLQSFIGAASNFVQGDVLDICRKLTLNSESAAAFIGTNKTFLRQVVAVGVSHTLSPTVYGESRRLLAALVKRGAGNLQLLHAITSCNGLPLIIDLLITGHPLMINEGLVSTIVVITSLPVTEPIRMTLTESLLPKLTALFTQAGQDKLPSELTANLLTLCLKLIERFELKDEIRSSVPCALVEQLLNQTNLQVKELAQNLRSMMT